MILCKARTIIYTALSVFDFDLNSDIRNDAGSLNGFKDHL